MSRSSTYSYGNCDDCNDKTCTCLYHEKRVKVNLDFEDLARQVSILKHNVINEVGKPGVSLIGIVELEYLTALEYLQLASIAFRKAHLHSET